MKNVKLLLFLKAKEHNRFGLWIGKSGRNQRRRDLPQTLEEQQIKAEQKRLFKKIKCECQNLTSAVETYIRNLRRSDLTEKYWEMLNNKFFQAKDKIEIHLQMLEDVGVEIPPEFRELMNRTNKLENFMYMLQYRKFSTQIYNMLSEIREKIV